MYIATGRYGVGVTAISSVLRQILNEHRTESSIYKPFRNSTDFALARWFFQSQCSKGDVDRFFSDRRLEPLWDNISFRSANQWHHMIHQTQHGINSDEWQQTVFNIRECSELDRGDHTIYYRDILSVIRYLIGHKPFAHHLHFAPEQHFYMDNDREIRTYHELYTADWWWETQERLPEGATVVPLLLATDKTQLTHQHGDKSAWPVYLTIGNLDRSTRRKQTSSATLLIGLIPNVTTDDAEVKAEVYHTAMKYILERMP